MFSFPITLILIPYGVIVALFLFMSLYSIHNLVRYGATSHGSFLATFAFLAGAVFVFFFTWQALIGTDWSQQINIAIPFSSIQPSL